MKWNGNIQLITWQQFNLNYNMFYGRATVQISLTHSCLLGKTFYYLFYGGANVSWCKCFMMFAASFICSVFVIMSSIWVWSPRAQEALKTGHFVSVLQVLMQLQRVCNHPELLAPRENSSSYFCSSLQYSIPSLVLGALQNDSSKVYTWLPTVFIQRLCVYDVLYFKNGIWNNYKLLGRKCNQ